MQAVDDKMKGVLSELMKQPYLKEYYLAGGTNLALRYGHRTSIDLDLFVHRRFDGDASFLLNNNLTESFGKRFESNSISEVGVFGYIDGVKVDFVNYPYTLLRAVKTIDGVRMASPIDIGAMKIKAIIGRGSRKDFFDIHRLTKEISLLKIMESFLEKYKTGNLELARRGLLYFGDAEDVTKRNNQFISTSNVSWEIIKKEMPKALQQMDSDRRVQIAVDFHKENDYLGKEGINPNNALNKTLKDKLGLVLTKPQLALVKKIISKGINQDNDFSF